MDLILLLSGALIGWALQQYYVLRSEDVSLLNDHIRDLERFTEAAHAYWLAQPTTNADDQLLASRVRVAHSSAVFLFPSTRALVGKRGIWFERRHELLFDLATGGKFETAGRLQDATRAIEIADASVRLIHIVRAARSDVISFRRFFIHLWRWLISILLHQPGDLRSTLEDQDLYEDRMRYRRQVERTN